MFARPPHHVLLAMITALLVPIAVVVPSSPAAAAEAVVVTPSTPGAYVETGTWANARDPGYEGSPSRYSRTPGSTATWTVVAPASARYDLAVYYNASVDNAKADYAWTGGPDTPTVVNQAIGGNAWRQIGSTYLDKGQTFTLTVTATAGPAVTAPNLNVITRANAVRLLEVTGDDQPPGTECGTHDTATPVVDAPERRFPSYRLSQHGTMVSVAGDGWAMAIDRRGFRYGLEVDGAPVASPHPTAGLQLAVPGGAPCDAVAATLAAADASSVRFSVTFANGRQADVTVVPADHSVNLRIAAGDSNTGSVRAQVAGGMNPAYGLGDLGGFRTDLNAYGIRNLDYYAQNSAGTTNQRFVSTFTVFPGRKLAQVVLSNESLAVQVDNAATLLGVNGPQMSGLHYFFGDMTTIYRRYAEVRRSAGYADAKPDYALFGVGYESYGALGYNTNQQTITSSVTAYLDEGFPLSWVVTGSGFWPYGSGSAQGTTSSFGLWGAKYPDPDGYKKFLHDNGIKLLLGARQSFRALPADGGTYDPALDGDGTAVGIERGYFIKDANGKPRVFRPVSFPNTAMYLIDPDNEEAVRWFVARSREWGADGYKEDHMFDGTANRYVNNALVNPINEGLDDDGKLMMVRNSAFSVAGSILRINDTDYNHGPGDRDRTVVNGLAYAASGQPNFYPDIVGGRIIGDLETNTSKQRYLTRNAMLAAMSPAMSFGNEPWRMNDSALVAATRKAAQWHAEYQPYIYSAAVTSYETGFPSTATPLPVAFPDDPRVRDLASAAKRQYEWMLGPSLLVAPLYGGDTDTAMSRDVYLPAGEWMDIETGERFTGPTTLTAYQQPFGKIPAFVGGTGILVHDPGARDPGDAVAAGDVRASVYPVAAPGATLTYTGSDGQTRSRITAKNTSWSTEDIVVRDSSGADIAFSRDPVTGAVEFPVEAGLDYVVSDADSPEWGLKVVDVRPAGPVVTGRALPVQFRLVDQTGAPAGRLVAEVVQVAPDGTERQPEFETDDQDRVHTVLTTQAGVTGTYVVVVKAADGRRLAHFTVKFT
ncbi:TIM-barrel domain-containing protein [Micromonospora sp. NPDC023966]|uniref:TIM-barrel domain-containing protein n=1 Tax=Micromonospora sp. NPDC023966 TaxID=3154699 RepID=UPI0033D5D110